MLKEFLADWKRAKSDRAVNQTVVKRVTSMHPAANLNQLDGVEIETDLEVESIRTD